MPLQHFLLGVRRITDHQEIVKQYQKLVRAYNTFMQDYPWESRGGLMEESFLVWRYVEG